MSWVWPPDTSRATKGNSGRRIGQQGRKQMAFQVMHADGRNAESRRQRIGEAGADQERTCQTRPLGIGDAVQIGESQPGFPPAPGPGQGNDPANVIAGSQFRHHAAIFGMHGHL
jgi:hypothetical protein